MKALRYLCYIAFIFAALVFWVLINYHVLGLISFGDPQCAFEPAGCAPPPLWKHALYLVVFFGGLPLTVFAFVLYRRWIRRKFGLED